MRFAAQLGVSRTAVDRYTKHERIPTIANMIKIYRVTKGLVTPNDFYGVGR